MLTRKKNQVALSGFVVEKKERQKSEYDALGRLTYSFDQISSTVKDGDRQVEWKAHAFNSQNRVFSDTTKTTVADRTTTVHRSLLKYNHLGQLNGYREKSTDTRKPDETTIREVSHIIYDAFGQIATSKDNILTEKYADTTKTENPSSPDHRNYSIQCGI